jgi:hypothetical protein
MLIILILPDDIFRYELFQYLTLYDIAIFDTAIINKKYRNEFLLLLNPIEICCADVISIGNLCCVDAISDRYFFK